MRVHSAVFKFTDTSGRAASSRRPGAAAHLVPRTAAAGKTPVTGSAFWRAASKRRRGETVPREQEFPFRRQPRLEVALAKQDPSMSAARPGLPRE